MVMFYIVETIPDNQTMQAVVAELLPLVPLVRRNKALRYKHLHGQFCCLRAWALLHELLVSHQFLSAGFSLAELTYAEDEHGKPWLTSSPDCNSPLIFDGKTICFSLSHTANALAVAIDHQPVGIDVEALISKQRVSDQHFLDHTMSAKEQVVIHQSANPQVAFTELWTRKEALFKAIGTGINMSELPGVLESPHAFTLQSIVSSDYVCSIAYSSDRR